MRSSSPAAAAEVIADAHPTGRRATVTAASRGIGAETARTPAGRPRRRAATPRSRWQPPLDLTGRRNEPAPSRTLTRTPARTRVRAEHRTPAPNPERRTGAGATRPRRPG